MSQPRNRRKARAQQARTTRHEAKRRAKRKQAAQGRRTRSADDRRATMLRFPTFPLPYLVGGGLPGVGVGRTQRQRQKVA